MFSLIPFVCDELRMTECKFSQYKNTVEVVGVFKGMGRLKLTF